MSHCIQLNENILVNKMFSHICENHLDCLWSWQFPCKSHRTQIGQFTYRHSGVDGLLQNRTTKNRDSHSCTHHPCNFWIGFNIIMWIEIQPLEKWVNQVMYLSGLGKYTPESPLAESSLPYINKKEAVSSSFYVIRAPKCPKVSKVVCFFHKYSESHLWSSAMPYDS